MHIEEAIELLQSLVFAKTDQHLDKVQIDVLRGAWENHTYDRIAETYCFSSAHVKTVGAKLWHLLSKVLGTKVNKKNVQVVLKRIARDWQQESSRRISSSPILELPGGQVLLDSPFYIERAPIEACSYHAILQPGALIRIYAPRQMGKTSLMARILEQARWQGNTTVTLNFKLANREVFTSLDKLLQWFCVSVGKSLGLSNQLADYWDEILGSKSNSTDYFENYLLAEIDTPLVLGLDEVDMVFQYPEIASDFFSLLRTWHEKAKYGDRRSYIWQKLKLVVVYATEDDAWLNLHQSFNVGLPIALPEFTQEQVQDLARCYGLNWDADQVAQLMSLVGGYPYLVRTALHHIYYQDFTLEQFLPKSATQGRVYGEYVGRQFLKRQQNRELYTAFAQKTSSPIPVELDWL